MFYEFAIDPELVTVWCDRVGYKGFVSQFGIDTRRIASRFPKKWERQVEDIFCESFPNATTLQKLRKTEIVSMLSKRMVKRGSKHYDPSQGWILNAEREHAERPFRSIISCNNPKELPFITVIKTADDILERLPVFPNSCIAPRTSLGLVAPIAPLLRCCHHAVFVDPYFDCSPRFIEPLKKCLEIMICERYGNASPKVELHTSIERCFKKYKVIRNEASEKNEATTILMSFKEKLSRIIPSGLSVRVVIWKEQTRGEQFHNRYLLTDIGSVSFGTGLDCNCESFHRELSQGQTDDIFCLSEDAHKQRWDEYIGVPVHELVDEINL